MAQSSASPSAAASTAPHDAPPSSYAQKVVGLVLRSPEDRRKSAGLVALMVVSASLEALGIGLVMPFVALVGDPSLAQRQPLLVWLSRTTAVTSYAGMVAVAGATLGAVYLLKNAFLAFVQWAQYRYIFGLEIRLANELFDRYLRRPYAFHLERNSAELIHDIHYETSQVYNHVGVSVFVIAVEVLSAAVIVLLLVALEPVVVPGVGLVLGGVAFLFYRYVQRRATHIGEIQRTTQSEMHKWLNQGLGGIKETTVLGRQSFFVDAYSRLNVRFGHALVWNHVMMVLPRYVLETVGVVALAAIAVAMGARGSTPAQILPVLGALAVAAVRLLPSAARLIGAIGLIRFCRPSVEALWRALEPMPGDDARASVATTDVPALGLRARLRLEDVGFRYPNAQDETLRGVDLEIRAGESVGLVGSSGAGKTTLVDVAIGLLSPSRGRVLVDDGEITGHALPRWQRSIGYIPQTTFLSDDTIRKNVAFGVSEEDIDDGRVLEALRSAQLDELVASLPAGVHTSVGERGVRLSGGQRQRIGIARALYLDPSLLVLDEATSALDSETEREIVASFERLKGRHTMLVIAHRLSTIRTCDRIACLAQGRVAGIGTWDELLATCEEFRRLVASAEAPRPQPEPG